MAGVPQAKQSTGLITELDPKVEMAARDCKAENTKNRAEAETRGKLSRARCLHQVPKSFAFLLNPEQSGRAERRFQMSIYFWVQPSAITGAWLDPLSVFHGWKEGSSEGRVNTWLTVMSPT